MFRGFFVALCALCLSHGLAFAQSLDLFSLPVAERLAPVATEPDAQITEVQADSDFTGSFTIDQSPLRTFLKSSGAPHIGSRHIPPQIWQGSDAQTLYSLMQNLKRSNDPSLMQFIRDVLLAETVLPQNSNDQDFLYHRAEGLLRLGWLDDAERLLKVAPENTPQLTEISDTAALYGFDEVRLCPRPEVQSSSLQAKKLKIFCLLKVGKNAEAELHSNILQETHPEVRTDGFALLVHLILLEETELPPETVIAPKPIHLLLARFGGITPRFAKDAALSPRILSMLINMPTIALDQRLAYAEAAYAASTAGSDDIQRLQFAKTFSDAERKNVITLLEQFPSPNARALLMQTLAESDDPADLVVAGLEHGDQHGLYEQMLDTSMAYLPVQASIPLARAHLAVQNFTKAKDSSSKSADRIESWLLQQIWQAQTSPVVVDEQDEFLQNLIIETDVESSTVDDPWQVWQKNTAIPLHHKALVSALVSGLDVVLPEHREPEAVPNNPELYGEALLHIVLKLSPPSAELDPISVQNALYSLKHMGFEDVAKAYAARRLAILLGSA